MIEASLIGVVETRDELGEGVTWDPRLGAFLWTDILGRRFHIYDLARGNLVTVELPERLCSFGLSGNEGQVIAAFDRGIAYLQVQTGEVEWLKRPDLPPGTRFNDGRTGPDGRFWVGTMVEDADASMRPDGAAMYSYDPLCGLSRHFDGIRISNGLAWGPDGRTMYHADSPARCVRKASFDAGMGRPGSFEAFLEFADGVSPDGATMDARGRYWSALWNGGRVSVHEADGKVAGRVDLPVSLVTCACFGGGSLDILAVTTAHCDLTADEKSQQPMAGHLFLYQTNATGLPPYKFAGATQA